MQTVNKKCWEAYRRERCQGPALGSCQKGRGRVPWAAQGPQEALAAAAASDQGVPVQQGQLPEPESGS